MWQVIAAIFGIADNANKGAQAQLARQDAARENDLNYSRAKKLQPYEQEKILTIAAVGIVGLLIVGMVIMTITKRK